MKNICKRSFSIFMCFIMMLSLSSVVFAADSVPNPYVISSEEDFVAFYQKVVDNKGYSNVKFSITEDLDLSSVNFTPIGTQAVPFKGILDGDGHTITLSLNGENNLGLFAYTDGATIQNITVTGSINGNSNIGGIVANAKNTVIDNCTATDLFIEVDGDNIGFIAGVTVGGTVQNCTTSEDSMLLSSTGKNCGGIVGNNNASIIKCLNQGYVSAQSNAGCIAGVTTGNISSSKHKASFINVNISNAGGITGYAENCTIKECSFEDAEIDGTGGGTYNFGGIVGEAKSVTIENCIFTGTIGAGSYVGGIYGKADTTTVTKCIANAVIYADSPCGAIGGNSINTSVSNCYYNISNEETVFGDGNLNANVATGVASSDIMSESSYPALDFTNVWVINNAHGGYPFLASFGEYHTLASESDLNPTCTEAGAKRSKCTICYVIIETEAIPALGHDFANIISRVDPTCTEKGSLEKGCSRCEAQNTTELDATGHKDENNDNKCDICGVKIKEEEPKKSFFQKIIDFFKAYFRWVKNLFNKIFNR